ncbi:MAG: hypothetical protein Q7R95_11755, partial [bacterium]|nr:hypothetical protein [bacterium]
MIIVENYNTKPKFFLILFLGFFSLAVCLTNFFDTEIFFTLCAFSLVFVVFISKPIIGLVILILLLPYFGVSISNYQIAGIPGLKLSTLLPIAVFISFYIMFRERVMQKLDRRFSIVFIMFFVIAVLRSMSYIHEYTVLFWKEEYEVIKYLLSHFLKPLLIFLSFITIVRFIKSKKELLIVVNSLVFSIIIL